MENILDCHGLVFTGFLALCIGGLIGAYLYWRWFP